MNDEDYSDVSMEEAMEELRKAISNPRWANQDYSSDRQWISKNPEKPSIDEEPANARLVVRSATDLIIQNKILEMHNNKVPFLCKTKNYTYPSGFKLSEWAIKEHQFPFFNGRDVCYLFFEWGWGYATMEGDEIIIEAVGHKKESEEWLNCQQEKHGFLDKVKYINWMFGPNYKNLQIRRVPLDTTKPIPSAYPWIGKSVDQYADEYLDDKASVLILIGPPGTGKTSFLKGLISRMKGQACVTYDSHLLSEDGIFAQFTEDRQMEAMIFEDADNFIGSRKDGNGMMHRFLNVSNGLVSPMKGKKIIFTTNLPSADEIDPALIRPGRCYEVIHFRTLTFTEAKNVAKDFYGDNLPDMENRDYTLAEVTNLSRVGVTKVKRKVGFL